jgi:hypothetical protein
MKLTDWVAVISVAFTALGGMAVLVQFLVKHYLAELRPNGGSSMKDQVNDLQKRVDEIYRILLNKTLS